MTLREYLGIGFLSGVLALSGCERKESIDWSKVPPPGSGSMSSSKPAPEAPVSRPWRFGGRPTNMEYIPSSGGKDSFLSFSLDYYLIEWEKSILIHVEDSPHIPKERIKAMIENRSFVEIEVEESNRFKKEYVLPASRISSDEDLIYMNLKQISQRGWYDYKKTKEAEEKETKERLDKYNKEEKARRERLRRAVDRLR